MSHTAQFTHIKCSVFYYVLNHHHNQLLAHFHHFRKTPRTPKATLLAVLGPDLRLSATNLPLALQTCLIFRDRLLSILSFLGFFICCSMYQSFIPFYCQVIFNFIDIPILFSR